MSLIDFDLFRQHCRADDAGDADDAVLRFYLDTATSVVIKATRRTVEELCAMSDTGDFPHELKMAVMLLGAHYYANREVADTVELKSIPYGMMYLVAPYRKLV